MAIEILPPLGTPVRHEIEKIRDKLRRKGYRLRFSSLQDQWVATLQRVDLRSGAMPHATGGTPLEAARNAWALYESTPHLNSYIPEDRPPEDIYFWAARGQIVIREGGGILPWLVSWYPHDEADPMWPGFTLSEPQFPTIGGVPGVLAWAATQPWSQRFPEQSEVAGLDAVYPQGLAVVIRPPEPGKHGSETATPAPQRLREKAYLPHSFEFAYGLEPDGSYSWAVSIDGEVLQAGVADNWDDAKLAAIEHIYPPSDD